MANVIEKYNWGWSCHRHVWFIPRIIPKKKLGLPMIRYDENGKPKKRTKPLKKGPFNYRSNGSWWFVTDLFVFSIHRYAWPLYIEFNEFFEMHDTLDSYFYYESFDFDDEEYDLLDDYRDDLHLLENYDENHFALAKFAYFLTSKDATAFDKKNKRIRISNKKKLHPPFQRTHEYYECIKNKDFIRTIFSACSVRYKKLFAEEPLLFHNLEKDGTDFDYINFKDIAKNLSDFNFSNYFSQGFFRKFFIPYETLCRVTKSVNFDWENPEILLYLNYSNVNMQNAKIFKQQIHFLLRESFSKLAQLTDMTCVDLLGQTTSKTKERFKLFYNFLSVYNSMRVFFTISWSELNNNVYSISDFCPSAGWAERECWDMFGTKFVGNLDLRRILTDYGFRGFPLRKDFPTVGFKQVKYDELADSVIYENLFLMQDERELNFVNPWRSSAPGSASLNTLCGNFITNKSIFPLYLKSILNAFGSKCSRLNK